MRRFHALALSCLATAVLAPQAAAAPTAVDITSPGEGATVSRSTDPVIDVRGTSVFAAPIATDKLFYLRGNGCGATEDLYLSASKGADEYDGCGIIGGLPAAGPLADTKVLDARDGANVVLDASKAVTGQVRAETWIGDPSVGVGQVTVDVSLFGISTDDEFVSIGSATATGTNTGAGGVNVPFSIAVDPSVAGTALKGLTMELTLSGVGYNTTNIGMEGDSFFRLPILDGGLVEVSDSSTFTKSRTFPATLGADGTWGAQLPTPAVGERTIFARATQVGKKVTATPVNITVVD